MRRQVFILFLISALTAGCVMKDDIVALDERIFRLEQRQKEMENRLSNVADVEDRVEEALADTQRQSKEQVQALRSQLAEIRVMNTQLREDFQDLSGRIEEMQFRFQHGAEGEQQSAQRMDSRLERIDSVASKNADRIDRLEQYLSLERQEPGPPAPQTPPAAESSPAPAAAEVEPTEDTLYRRAKDAMEGGEFGKARDAFQELLDRFPQSNQADNAQFWIGETYYREKWYEKAILEYQKVIEQYPEGNKLPAALLKQGFAFDQLGDSVNARLILKELVRKYPESNEAKIAREKLDKLI